MITALLLTVALAVPSAAPRNAFDVQTQLQGLYDEITDGTLQFLTPADVDLFHDMLYAPGFVFIDAAGQVHKWQAIREQQVAALGAPLPDAATQVIRKLTLVHDGAIAAVTMTTVRTVVDDEGRYGRKGASHTVTEITPFRDQWARVDDAWKLLSRTQTGRMTVAVDKDERGL